MIDFVQGTLYSIDEDSITVNVHGVGYLIYTARPEVFKSQLNDECFIHTHHYFREDWSGLFGFKDKDERRLFRLLLSVSGIGPKGALSIIAQADPKQVITAIALEDEKSLTKLPGVGKKTAQRIILDLKDKVKDIKISTIHITKGDTSVKDDHDLLLDKNSELTEALKALGYSEQEIALAVRGLADKVDSDPIETLIKKALQILMKG